MRAMRLAGAIVIVALLLNVLTPRRAAASFSDGLVIGGIIAGAIVVVSAVVGLIAIAGSNDQPHFLVEPPASAPPGMRPAGDRVRFGMQCRATAEGPALVCW